MIKLYQYPGIWDLPSLSPFCSKVYYFLEWFQIEFKVIHVNNPRRSPKGKFPVIKDGDLIIADSEHIVQYLCQSYRPNLTLTSEEHTIVRMIEEHLYFVILYSRWIDPKNKSIIDQHFKPFFPRGFAKPCLGIIRRQLRKQGYYQGLSRHTGDEIYAKGLADLGALEPYIERVMDHQTFCPRLADTSLYSFLLTIKNTPIDNPLRSYIQNSSIIGHYLAGLSHVGEEQAPSTHAQQAHF